MSHIRGEAFLPSAPSRSRPDFGIIFILFFISHRLFSTLAVLDYLKPVLAPNCFHLYMTIIDGNVHIRCRLETELSAYTNDLSRFPVPMRACLHNLTFSFSYEITLPATHDCTTMECHHHEQEVDISLFAILLFPYRFHIGHVFLPNSQSFMAH